MFGLYLHIPFCLAKCPYCDFNSYAGSTRSMRDEYVDALCREIAARLPGSTLTPGPSPANATMAKDECCVGGRGVRGEGIIATIFFGGGTPSLLEGEQVARILDTVHANARLADDCEITLEANPGTLPDSPRPHSQTPTLPNEAIVEASLDKLLAFRAAGVNRLSFGVQSLHNHHLRTLGRLHTAREAIEAYRLARAAEFDNINLDFIFAIPGQTIAEWEQTLAHAIALAPEHLSCYGLTIEEGTPFFDWHRKGRLRTLEEDTEAAMFEATRNRLAAAEYEAYEVSNFAKPGRRCRHNLIYWRDEDYLGCGAGAHSSLAGVRSWNERNPKRYANLVNARGEATVGRESLPTREKLGEAMMLGLRLVDGVDLTKLQERFAVEPMAEFEREFDWLTRAGLLEVQNSRARLSSKGLLVANTVMAEFVVTER